MVEAAIDGKIFESVNGWGYRRRENTYRAIRREKGLRDELKRLANYCCEYCGRQIRKKSRLTAHHYRGIGLHNRWTIRWLCRSCHRRFNEWNIERIRRHEKQQRLIYLNNWPVY